MNHRILLTLAASLILVGCQRPFTSPSGKIELNAFFNEQGTVVYEVYHNQQPIILPSELGLTFVTSLGDTVDNSGWQITSTSRRSHNDTWETVWGEEQFIQNNYRELTLHLTHSLNSKLSTLNLDIIFRLFDDGFAFRYVFPSADTLTVLDEHTSYTFAQEPHVWSIPWRTEYYEGLWTKQPLSQLDTVCSPITLELADGTFGFIHEAALTDYPCQNLYLSTSQPLHLSTYLTPWIKNHRIFRDKAYITAPFATPWRFVILTPTLRELVASRIMLNLNESCAIEDPSWIRPMKFIGIWWGMHMKNWTWRQGPNHGATTANMKNYLTFAAEHHIDAVLAEGWNLGWEGYEGINHDRFSFVTPYPDYDLEYLSRYADSLGVQIVCHHETSGRANEYEADLDTAYQFMQAHNMHAVKTGYVAPIITTNDGHQFNRSQSGVRHYRKVIETAAKYHVMIDNHEPAMPTGLQRTYPNLMTQEGIRGQEWNAWSQDGGSPASHVCTLPFTRMLAGPADYTPGVFNFANPIIPGTRVHSTLMNQLGLFVVLYSPLQMACDKIENYERYPDAFQFISDVPCDWKQSILLDGEIGEYCVFARQDRNSDDWYIGGVTNEARTFDLDGTTLPLDPAATYEVTVYRDAADADWQTNPYAYEIETLLLYPSTPLHFSIPLANGGGFAIRIAKSY